MSMFAGRVYAVFNEGWLGGLGGLTGGGARIFKENGSFAFLRSKIEGVCYSLRLV